MLPQPRGAGASEEDAFAAALSSLSTVIQDQDTAGTQLDLTDATDLSAIETAFVSSASSLSGLDTASLNGVVGNVTTAVNNVNDAIDALANTDLTDPENENAFGLIGVLQDQVEEAAEGGDSITLTDPDEVDTAASNAAPTDIVLSEDTIADGATDYTIGSLSATDDATVDPNFIYSIAEIDDTDFASFTINQASRELSLTSEPNYDTQSSYSVVIVAEDEGGKKYSETFSINVTSSYFGPFWTDAEVADSADVSITGTTADEYIGYSSASTPDPLSNLGKGSGNTATFDMSLGGDNAFLAATSVAAWGGSFAYTGGSGDDSLTFSDDLAAHDGNATFDMSRGGTNTFAAGDDAAAYSGSLVYTGGAGNDSLTFGGWLAQSGTATFDLSSGGNNTFVAAQSAAYFSGSVAYTGGSGDDSLTFGGWLALEGGSATFDLSLGGNNTFVVGASAASSSGRVEYSGSPGRDTVTFGTAAAAASGEIVIDMGSDTAADTVTFEGTVDPAGAGGVTIDNFDVNHDTIMLAQPDAADVTLITDGTGTRVTATDIEFTIKGITADQLMAFDGASGVKIRSYLGPFWTDDEVADSADVSITGTTADEYIGYSSTSTPDSLSNLGQGSGNTATFDMSAGGTNRLSAGSSVAASGGQFIYTGGADRDILSFGPDAAKEGQMSIDLGDDSSIDEITFVGLVGAHTPDAALNSVSIANFKADDTITLQAFTHNQITFTPYADNTLVTAPSGLAFTVSGLSPNQVEAISDNGSAQIRVSGAGSSAATSAFFSL